MGFEAHDLQIVNVQDVSSDELNKKELNDKATAFKERHVEMQQIFFQQQDLRHMARKVEKLHMAGVLLVECEDATSDATKPFKDSNGGSTVSQLVANEGAGGGTQLKRSGTHILNCKCAMHTMHLCLLNPSGSFECSGNLLRL